MMPNQNVRGEPYRNLRLCVDSYENGVLAGRLYYTGLESGSAVFHSFVDLVVRMESLLDEAKFPQSYTARRYFVPLGGGLSDREAPESAGQTGKLATFVVRLLFRQHASWQGSVTWLEGKGEQNFRSVLELVLLMDSALGGCEEATA